MDSLFVCLCVRESGAEFLCNAYQEQRSLPNYKFTAYGMNAEKALSAKKPTTTPCLERPLLIRFTCSLQCVLFLCWNNTVQWQRVKVSVVTTECANTCNLFSVLVNHPCRLVLSYEQPLWRLPRKHKNIYLLTERRKHLFTSQQHCSKGEEMDKIFWVENFLWILFILSKLFRQRIRSSCLENFCIWPKSWLFFSCNTKSKLMCLVVCLTCK